MATPRDGTAGKRRADSSAAAAAPAAAVAAAAVAAAAAAQLAANYRKEGGRGSLRQHRHCRAGALATQPSRFHQIRLQYLQIPAVSDGVRREGLHRMWRGACRRRPGGNQGTEECYEWRCSPLQGKHTHFRGADTCMVATVAMKSPESQTLPGETTHPPTLERDSDRDAASAAVPAAAPAPPPLPGRKRSAMAPIAATPHRLLTRKETLRSTPTAGREPAPEQAAAGAAGPQNRQSVPAH